MENVCGLGTGPALKLRFYGPGDGRTAVALENRVGYYGVDVLGIDEEAVHVEERGPYAGRWDCSTESC